MKSDNHVKVKRNGFRILLINTILIIIVITFNIVIRNKTTISVDLDEGTQIVSAIKTYGDYFELISNVSIAILGISLIVSMFILYKENKHVSKRLEVLVNKFDQVGLSKVEVNNPILTEYDKQILNAWNRSVNEIDYLNELREKYFKNMVHDLKTPIQILTMNIEMIKFDYPENKYVLAVEEELKQLEKSVTNYLMIEKITFFESVNNVEVNIDAYFHNIIYRYKLLDCNISFYNYSGHSVLSLDQSMVNRIFENIVDNAIKYGIGRDVLIVITENTFEIINTVAENEEIGDIFSQERTYSLLGNGLGVEIINTYIRLLNWSIESYKVKDKFIVSIVYK